MGKPSAPAAPDYRGAAQATAQGNLEQTRAAMAGSLINQNTPYGNLTYTQSGTDQFGNPMWTANQTLSPEQQALYQSGNQAAQQYANLANQGLMNVSGVLSQPGINQSTLPKAPIDAGTTAQQAIMARLEPQLQRQSASLENQLANQGISLGSEAYKTAKEQQAQQQNDLLSQASLQGINLDQAARQQAIQEQLTGQNQTMNLLNALRTGSQVTNPQWMNTPQQQAVSGADLLGAASAQGTYQQGLYNAQMGGSNNMMGGLFGLGGAAIKQWG